MARTTHGTVCMVSLFFSLVTGPTYARDKGPEVVMKGLNQCSVKVKVEKTGGDQGTFGS